MSSQPTTPSRHSRGTEVITCCAIALVVGIMDLRFGDGLGCPSPNRKYPRPRRMGWANAQMRDIARKEG
jgi:hypothetical protein